MRKFIIIILLCSTVSITADAQILRKFFSTAFYYGLLHHPTLPSAVPPVGYNFEFEAAPADSIKMGVGTAYDTSLGDHRTMSDLLTAMAAIGAVLGLWFLYLSVAPKLKSPKRAAVDSNNHCVLAKHDDISPRNRQSRFVYLAGNGGVMFI